MLSSKNKARFLSVFIVLAMLFSFANVSPAHAVGGIVVNSDADTVANDGACTMREAITAANSDTASGATFGECAAGGGADSITFDADYTITLVGSQLPVVTSEITITGNGAANTIIQANAAANTATYRVFEMTSTGNLTLDGVTVRHGRCAGGCATYPFDGGGILNKGTLTVTNSTISGNSASASLGYGGGIYNLGGPLAVTNSTISRNAARYGGGILNNGTLTVTNSTLSGNAARYGGGIFAGSGTLTVTNSTLSRNSAGESGGGIDNLFGTLSVTRSLISGNTAAAGDEVYRYSGTVSANAYNVFGHSGQSNADAFFGFSPNASNFNATSNGGTSTPLASILDTALADNGGPTQTHALVAGSPAIDFAGACRLATDQRGVARPQGAACDAGAFELTNQPPTAVAGGSYEGLPNNAIALSGASASDDDGDPLSYSWTVNSSNCAFSDATTLNPSLTCTTDGSYTVTLTVDDGTVMTNDSATVTVITAQQGTENLQSDIQSLVNDEILKAGQAKGLLTPLDNAIRSLDKGNVEDACNQLNDFIVKVEDKTPDPLDAATAAGLIDSAEALKSSIGCQ